MVMFLLLNGCCGDLHSTRNLTMNFLSFRSLAPMYYQREKIGGIK